MIDCLIESECLFAATAVTQLIFTYVAVWLCVLLLTFLMIDDLDQILGLSSARPRRKNVNYWLLFKRSLRRCAVRFLPSARRKQADRTSGSGE